jgi:hypothetical protein
LDTAIFQQQLQSILKEFVAWRAKSEFNDLSDFPKHDRQAFVTRAVASIHRISGRESAYSKEVERLLKELPHLHEHISSIMGVVKGLLDDMAAGYTKSLVEIVHSDIFSDFLEMARHLCGSGCKDAGAVVAGSTLESHLRELCHKAGLPVEVVKVSGDNVPKKADSMNSELASAGVYSKLDQKSVTAWLDLRNKAAHGEYATYSQEQVALLISGVRDFISRNPA